MKRTFPALSLSVLIALFLLFSLNINLVFGQNEGYVIQNVDYEVEVLYSGQIVLRENITLTGQAQDSLVVGFPYRYGSHILKSMAFDQSGPLQMDLGVQLGNRSGFYGVEIRLSESAPQIFTVVFILSNDLLISSGSEYNLDFPAYPSFMTDAVSCNVALDLPGDVSSLSIMKTDGNISTPTFTRENLSAFTSSPATATFSFSAGAIQQMEISSLSQTFTIYPAGEIGASDSYRITNNSPEAITMLQFDLPNTASNVAGRDEFGRTLKPSVHIGNGSVATASFTLQSSVGVGQSATITLEYNLPNAPSEQTTHFAFGVNLFPVVNYYVNDASLTVVLPEGAHFVAPQIAALNPYVGVDRELFQEELQINKEGISYVDQQLPDASLQVVYEYNPLWLSFRPTLGVWALSIVGSILVSVWRRPKVGPSRRTAVPRLSAGLSPDNVRAFTEAYEERRSIAHELRVLHARAQKGKIPRNFYKSQRRNLETRLNALSKDIDQLKETFRNAGGRYGNLIRQLDSAENDLAKARTRIRQAETRHKTGELKIEDYKKALSDYQRQKEKLELQIKGTLLRLREEIR